MGVVLRVARCDDGTLFSLPQSCVTTGDTTSLRDSEIAAPEVTYVDDEAMLLTSTSPSSLVKAAPQVVQLICEIFGSLGMVVNWGTGKTDAFLSLRGKKSTELKSELWSSDAPGIAIDPKCGAERLRLVRDYKHLGSTLTDDANNNLEAIRRSRSGLSAYVPIAMKVFGARCISLRLRLDLAATLVFSRLLYNVHGWSTISRWAYGKLNGVYMRVLRRVADLSCTGSSSRCASNLVVRKRLGMPVLETFIRQRRLLYSNAMLRSDAQALKSMLSICDPHGVPVGQWVKLHYDDLCALRDYQGSRLAELGDPLNDITSWARLATEYPAVWGQLIRSLVVYSSTAESRCDGRVAGAGPEFECNLCHTGAACFPTLKALQSQMRSQHKVSNALKRYIDDSGVCPACCTMFASRTRLLSHVSERRTRGWSPISCNALLNTGVLPEFDAEKLRACDEADRTSRRAALKQGHSQPVVQHAAAKRARQRGVAKAGFRQNTRLTRKTRNVDVQRAHARYLLLNADGMPRKRCRITSKTSVCESIVQNLTFSAKQARSELALYQSEGCPSGVF